MATKKTKNRGGLLYSTNPDAFNSEYSVDEQVKTLPPDRQDLRVLIERKLKGGKVATIIYQFVGCSEDLETLARRLKQSLSVGGSAKDGEIVLQGDCRDRVCTLLAQWGYRFKKVGG